LKRLKRNWRNWKGSKFFWKKNLKRERTVINALNPIEEWYDLYLEEEETPWIMEINDDGLDFDLDNKDKLANLYLKL